MKASLIHLVNGALLIIVLIGVPSITSRSLSGRWAISSTPDAQMLTLGGLALGALVNLLGAIYLTANAKHRSLHYRWTAVFLGLLIFEFLVFNGRISFQWLKEFLLAARKRLRDLF